MTMSDQVGQDRLPHQTLTPDVRSPVRPESADLWDRIVAGVVDAVAAVPGVDDAAGIVRKDLRAALPSAPAQPSSEVGEVGEVGGDADDRPPAELDGGPVHIPTDAPATLQEALRRAAALAPDKGTIYIRNGSPDVVQTYAELLAEAERVLGGLRAEGLLAGDAALFVFDDNRLFLTAYWACVLGGFLPTPVAVAPTYDTPNEANRKLYNAWEMLDRPVLLTDAATAGSLGAARALWVEPDVRIVTVERLLDHAPERQWFPATPDSPVLNMLTSGSTGVPKCVQHTNASVVARTYAAAERSGLTADDVTLTWMPFDHVTVPMNNVRDVFFHCMHVNAKTSHMLGDCTLWLDWIHRFRVTNTWAPNFAIAMVNERADDIRTRSWDLSCLREITNGGEPVVASTSYQFLDLLAQHRLPADAMAPAWGMSETCSGVTYSCHSRNDRSSGTVTIDPASLSRTVRHLDAGDRAGVVLSSVGRPIPGVQVRVVDESGRVLPEDRMGELHVRGRTMMQGYFRNPEAQRESWNDEGWFRTGDLAFVHDGELVIAGRIKDQIIVRGINYLAHELETVIERVDGVRLTFSAAAGVREPGESTDRLVIFFVPERWDPACLFVTAANVRTALAREAGLAPDLLVPVTEAEFLKTNSGKIQRAALVKELRAGTFDDRVIGVDRTEHQPQIWLAGRRWTQLPPVVPATGPTGTTLVLADADDLARLAISTATAVAVRGDAFEQDVPGRYRVAAADRADMRRLLTAVTERYGPLSTVVSALPLSVRGTTIDRLTAATAELTALFAALQEQEFGALRVLVLTASALHVRPGDRVDLGLCALSGLVRTAATEEPGFVIRQVDLPYDSDEWAEAVLAERGDASSSGVVAVRDGRRWTPKLVPLDEDTVDLTRPSVVAGGLYLMTGGLGAVAQEIAGHLAVDYGLRLLLVGRSAATGARGGQLRELNALGDVTYEQLDVADAEALEAAVSAAETRWGRGLDGVFHLAAADPTCGRTDPDRHRVANESMEAFVAQYRAKVAGTLAVAKVLDSRPEASLTLFGSVNGEFGGDSFGAYSAANSFLTGFADHWHHERVRTVRCIAWSMWSGLGMSRDESPAAAQRRGFRPIEVATGLGLLRAALAMPDHYIIAGLDLKNPRIIEDVLADRLAVSEVVVLYAGSNAVREAVDAALAAHTGDCPVPLRLMEVARIPRDPVGRVDSARILLEDVDTPKRAFVAPAGDLERRLARIWSAALNRPEIGRDDTFFALGGNSLHAVRLLALLEREMGIRITTHELYENATLADMAAVVHRSGTLRATMR